MHWILLFILAIEARSLLASGTSVKAFNSGKHKIIAKALVIDDYALRRKKNAIAVPA